MPGVQNKVSELRSLRDSLAMSISISHRRVQFQIAASQPFTADNSSMRRLDSRVADADRQPGVRQPIDHRVRGSGVGDHTAARRLRPRSCLRLQQHHNGSNSRRRLTSQQQQLLLLMFVVVARFVIIISSRRAEDVFDGDMCRFVDLENPRDFWCDPSIRTLMVESDAGRRTVMRALKELEAKGFITRRP